MAASLVYTPSTYDTLPSLHHAASEYERRNVSHILDTSIRPLFLDSNLYEKYGISLLHKHFSMDPTERLVEFHNTSTPWSIGEGNTDATLRHHDGFIVPRTFTFKDDESPDAGLPMPYEFEFTYDEPKAFTETEMAFFKAFAALLVAYKLQDILGICLLTDANNDFPLEITEGRANIMIKGDSVPEDQVTEAVWVFSPEPDAATNEIAGEGAEAREAPSPPGKVSYKKRCIKTCRKTGPLHNHHAHRPKPG
ncbi:hypothetical protein EST38_g9774 [Candolleomyces aberdarensis]|uniref:Uncharacterized protein n=1 Tax=Candolleomyces aberdarensis TaxID=2316362 RepID=A0A4Q2D936_9AGAR|nr:hypothetical protein EST38_g9774 [Candolleomyces aberdarensis]